MFRFNKQLGIALIMVLIVLQIISLIVLLSLQSNQYMKKIIRSEWAQVLLLENALSILQDVEKIFSMEWPRCKIDVPRNPIAEPLSFWQSNQTCTGNFNDLQYYYVAEDIGHDSCAQVPVIYLRITLLVMNKQMTARSLLQSILIIPDLISKRCERPIHQVIMGRQLWREIQ